MKKIVSPKQYDKNKQTNKEIAIFGQDKSRLKLQFNQILNNQPVNNTLNNNLDFQSIQTNKKSNFKQKISNQLHSQQNLYSVLQKTQSNIKQNQKLSSLNQPKSDKQKLYGEQNNHQGRQKQHQRQYKIQKEDILSRIQELRNKIKVNNNSPKKSVFKTALDKHNLDKHHQRCVKSQQNAQNKYNYSQQQTHHPSLASNLQSSHLPYQLVTQIYTSCKTLQHSISTSLQSLNQHYQSYHQQINSTFTQLIQKISQLHQKSTQMIQQWKQKQLLQGKIQQKIYKFISMVKKLKRVYLLNNNNNNNIDSNNIYNNNNNIKQVIFINQQQKNRYVNLVQQGQQIIKSIKLHSSIISKKSIQFSQISQNIIKTLEQYQQYVYECINHDEDDEIYDKLKLGKETQILINDEIDYNNNNEYDNLIKNKQIQTNLQQNNNNNNIIIQTNIKNNNNKPNDNQYSNFNKIYKLKTKQSLLLTDSLTLSKSFEFPKINNKQSLLLMNQQQDQRQQHNQSNLNNKQNQQNQINIEALQNLARKMTSSLEFRPSDLTKDFVLQIRRQISNEKNKDKVNDGKNTEDDGKIQDNTTQLKQDSSQYKQQQHENNNINQQIKPITLQQNNTIKPNHKSSNHYQLSQDEYLNQNQQQKKQQQNNNQQSISKKVDYNYQNLNSNQNNKKKSQINCKESLLLDGFYEPQVQQKQKSMKNHNHQQHTLKQKSSNQQKKQTQTILKQKPQQHQQTLTHPQQQQYLSKSDLCKQQTIRSPKDYFAQNKFYSPKQYKKSKQRVLTQPEQQNISQDYQNQFKNCEQLQNYKSDQNITSFKEDIKSFKDGNIIQMLNNKSNNKKIFVTQRFQLIKYAQQEIPKSSSTRNLNNSNNHKNYQSKLKNNKYINTQDFYFIKRNNVDINFNNNLNQSKIINNNLNNLNNLNNNTSNIKSNTTIALKDFNHTNNNQTLLSSSLKHIETKLFSSPKNIINNRQNTINSKRLSSNLIKKDNKYQTRRQNKFQFNFLNTCKSLDNLRTSLSMNSPNKLQDRIAFNSHRIGMNMNNFFSTTNKDNYLSLHHISSLKNLPSAYSHHDLTKPQKPLQPFNTKRIQSSRYNKQIKQNCLDTLRKQKIKFQKIKNNQIGIKIQ